MSVALFQIILNVVLNLFGVLFAIAAIVLYSIDLAIGDLDLCSSFLDYDKYDEHYQEKCENVQEMLLVSLVSEILV